MNDIGYNDHEGYLKGLISHLYPTVDWSEPKPAHKLAGHSIIPDGRIGSDWVIELEGPKGLKQTRGALVDLAISQGQLKLLIVLFAPFPGSSMSSKSLEQHLMEVAQAIGPDKTWCIVALSNAMTKEEHLSLISDATRVHGLEPTRTAYVS